MSEEAKQAIKDARKKYKGFTIKDKGYWIADDTQLIYKSELLDDDGEPRLKDMIFMVKNTPRLLTTSLRLLLTEHLLNSETVLPAGIIYYDDNERFKIPCHYFPYMEPDAKNVKEQIEEIIGEPIAEADAPIPQEPVKTIEQAVETGISSFDHLGHSVKYDGEDIDKVFGPVEIDALELAQRTVADRPLIYEDTLFFADLAGDSPTDFVLMSVNNYIEKISISALSEEELSKLFINLIILNKIKSNS